jgi:hypothetical protein
MPGFDRPRRRLAAAALLALLVACASPPRAVLAVDPAVTVVAPGVTVAFAATVTGSDEPVVWEVVEPGGGTVDERGRYTAPADEGTFHVRAWVGSLETLRTSEVRVRRTAVAIARRTGPGRPPPFR